MRLADPHWTTGGRQYLVRAGVRPCASLGVSCALACSRVRAWVNRAHWRCVGVGGGVACWLVWRVGWCVWAWAGVVCWLVDGLGLGACVGWVRCWCVGGKGWRCLICLGDLPGLVAGLRACAYARPHAHARRTPPALAAAAAAAAGAAWDWLPLLLPLPAPSGGPIYPPRAAAEKFLPPMGVTPRQRKNLEKSA